MKWKYISVALLVLFFVYLANSNPSKGDYTEWSSKQFMTRNDVNEKLTAIEKEDPDGLFGELATIGKKLAKNYVKPQVRLLIDHYTERSDYIFFSTYTTEFTIGEKNYKYVSIGLSHIFIPIEMPKKEEGTAK